MIKLYDLNAETRRLLDSFSGHEVMLILEMATDLQLQFDEYRGRARMGENGCVELVCALLIWMQDYHKRNNGKGNCNDR